MCQRCPDTEPTAVFLRRARGEAALLVDADCASKGFGVSVHVAVHVKVHGTANVNVNVKGCAERRFCGLDDSGMGWRTKMSTRLGLSERRWATAVVDSPACKGLPLRQ
jgi:hypothetical protein